MRNDVKEIPLALMLEATNVGILCSDREGRILYANTAAGKILGREQGGVIGRFIGDITLEAWIAFQRIMETGVPQDGVKIQTDASTLIADRNPVRDGKEIVGVVSVFKEISRYEDTAKELQTYKELAKQLDVVIRSSYDGLYITDGNANTLLFNKAYLRISGLKAEDLEGKNVRDLMSQRTISHSSTLEVMEKRIHVTVMQEFPNGKTAIVTGTPVFDEAGRIVLVVNNVRDITELNDLREELQETRTLAQIYKDELSKASLAGIDRGEVAFRSAAMENCIRLALRVGDVSSPVLLTGESGVGKGMLAKIIHFQGRRKKGPFIHVNCGAIPDGLLESELFGYEKGAFTGASGEGKPGMFEMADKGTLFLDEVGEVPPVLQVKLLKALDESEVRRLGGTRSREIDVRIVAATNRNLQEMVKERCFREDLYFRLNVFPINIPPLRERVEDILPLVDRMLTNLNRKYKKSKRFHHDAMNLLTLYPFPGNVRELQNIVERGFILADGKWVEPMHLPTDLQGLGASRGLVREMGVRHVEGDHLDEILGRVEKGVLEDCRRRYKTTYEIARVLKVNQSTIVRKLKKYGITVRDA